MGEKQTDRNALGSSAGKAEGNDRFKRSVFVVLSLTRLFTRDTIKAVLYAISFWFEYNALSCMKRTSLVFTATLFALLVLFPVGRNVTAQETGLLDREDIVALTKPAVVRIVQRVKGTATLPALTIDIRNRSVAVDPTRPARAIPVEEVLSGSGFIVSSDGYIVTNSHVVSLQTTKIDVMTSVVLPALYDSALSLSEQEASAFLQDQEATFEFSKKIFAYAAEHGMFDVKQDIAVLDPSSGKEKFDELLAEGFPVQVVSVNDNFYDDDRDIALIKIDRQGLPTLPLGGSDRLGVGRQVFIFGFPATAEFNQRNPLESTFTQGVVSALKDSQKKDFKVFQTDAKVSDGSSGGPLVDGDGNVAGIITFQSGQLQGDSGDNFAFAIPVEMVREMIEASGVAIEPSAYGAHLHQGLNLLREKHCLDALREFDVAKEDDPAFALDRYVDPYIVRCRLLIDSGQSIDTLGSRLKHVAGNVGPIAWLGAGIGAIFLLTFVAIASWLIREVHKEEREIRTLRRRLHEEEKREYQDRRMIEKLSEKDDK